MNPVENDIFERLNSYADSHPNFVNLWKDYIKVKKFNYLKSISNCDQMIENLETTEDISVESIALLLLVCNNLNT